MTINSGKSKAGEQIDNAELYERHKQFVSEAQSSAAPVIIATGIRTPENMGSILRHADAAGCKKVVFVDSNSGIPDRKLNRIARNTGRNLQVEFLNQQQFLDTINLFPQLIAVEITTRSRSLYLSNLPNSCCFVLGSERHGIPQGILDCCSSAIHIPMYGINASMNVSHAMTLVLFEWRRQNSG